MKILIIYDYFYPAYQAGGIIQSLNNLYNALKNDFNMQVICSNTDLNNKELINHHQLETVTYISKFKILKHLFQLEKSSLSHVYLNGIFSPFFFLIPLIYFKLFYPKIKIVIAPRGMMQAGALEIKSDKKKYYIQLLKTTRLFNNNIWHATDEQELIDIKKIVGENNHVVIAKNIPKIPIPAIKTIEKENNTLKLVFLSLITEKKNLHLILESIKHIKFNLLFDIYGPIKDVNYWEICKTMINDLPVNIQVNYKGPIEPIFVQEAIQNYHGLILPSKGENFGHAIYESLSVGRPVIISEFTPWISLNEKKAGWNTAITAKSISEAILELNSIDSNIYTLYCNNAHKLAFTYYQESTQMYAYEKLFK